jgi:gas vesicle protein
MPIDLNTLGTIASIASFILAFVFWWLASKQTENARRTLDEIKDKIMSWQEKMNTAAINLIEARPEVIAQKVSLEEAKNNSEFMSRIADVVEKLANEANAESTGYKMAIIRELLAHQKSMIVERDKIKADTIIAQQERKPKQEDNK